MTEILTTESMIVLTVQLPREVSSASDKGSSALTSGTPGRLLSDQGNYQRNAGKAEHGGKDLWKARLRDALEDPQHLVV